jgi:hypothetical protein
MAFNVPQREVSQQDIGAAPIPENRVFASEAAFGGTSARALQGVGQSFQHTARTLSIIAIEQQDKADVSLAVESYNKFRDGWRGLDKGFKSRLGLDAKGVTSEGTKSFDDTAFKMSEQLKGSARTRFQSLVQGSRNSSLDGLARYEQSQNQAAFENQMNALTETAINDGIEDFKNPAVAANSKLMIDTSIRAMLQGQAPEVIDAAIKEQTSVMQEGIIDRIAGIDITAANDYFEANKDDLTAGAIVKIEKSMALKMSAEQAEELVASIYDEDIPIDDIVSEIQQSDKPQNVKDDAVRRAKDRRSIDDSADRQRNETAYETAYENIVAGNGIETLAPDVLAELSQEDIAKLKTLDSNVANNHAPVSNSKSWQDIMTMPIQELAAKDILREYGTSLTQQDLKNALTLQQSARATLSGGNKDTKMIRAGDYNEALQVIASSAGLIGKDDVFKDLRQDDNIKSRRFQEFDKAFRNEVDTWLANNKGKNLSKTEIIEIGNGLLAEQVYLDAGFFSFEKEFPIAALTPDDIEEAYIKGGEIDPVVRNVIIGAFNTKRKLNRSDVADMMLDVRLNRPVDKVTASDIPEDMLVGIRAAFDTQGVTFRSDVERDQAYVNLYLKGIFNELR